MAVKSRQRRTLIIMLLGASALPACGAAQTTSSTAGDPAPPQGPVRGSFGGVVQVVFDAGVNDAQVQDLTAAGCGLTGGRRAGPTDSPLPPNIRWYPEPPTGGAETIPCLRSSPLVLTATLPL